MQLTFSPSELLTRLIHSKLDEISSTLNLKGKTSYSSEQFAKIAKQTRDQGYNLDELFIKSNSNNNEQAPHDEKDIPHPPHSLFTFSLPSFSFLSSHSSEHYDSTAPSAETSPDSSANEDDEYSSYYSSTQDEDDGSSDSEGSADDFYVSRFAFINWVSGVIEPTTLVPPLKCIDGSEQIFTIPLSNEENKKFIG